MKMLGQYLLPSIKLDENITIEYEYNIKKGKITVNDLLTYLLRQSH